MENIIPVQVQQIIPVSNDEAKEWRSRLCVILAHPRSGSCWIRRMLAEIIAIRHGMDGVTLNVDLDDVVGFAPSPINHEFWKEANTPLFTCAHYTQLHEKEHIKIFLRRNFDDVFRSCKKAEKENKDPCFMGDRDALYVRWKAVTEYGCLNADLVLDYKMIQQSPAAAVRAIFKVARFEVTDEEVVRAVLAGSRKNMLNEQSEHPRKDGFELINTENCYA